MGCPLMIWPGGVPTCKDTQQPCTCTFHKADMKPHAWDCPDSPDGYCHYEQEVTEQDGKRTLTLYTGDEVDAPPEPLDVTIEKLRVRVRRGDMTEEEFHTTVEAMPEDPDLPNCYDDCLYCSLPEERK